MACIFSMRTRSTIHLYIKKNIQKIVGKRTTDATHKKFVGKKTTGATCNKLWGRRQPVQRLMITKGKA
jgi:hypothetical protein